MFMFKNTTKHYILWKTMTDSLIMHTLISETFPITFTANRNLMF